MKQYPKEISADEYRRGKVSHKTEIEAIRRYVEMVGGACYVLHQSGRLHGSAGIPDLYILMPHRMGVWFEVKVGPDNLSAAQKRFAELARKAGDLVEVGGLDEVVALNQW